MTTMEAVHRMARRPSGSQRREATLERQIRALERYQAEAWDMEREAKEFSWVRQRECVRRLQVLRHARETRRRAIDPAELAELRTTDVPSSESESEFRAADWLPAVVPLRWDAPRTAAIPVFVDGVQVGCQLDPGLKRWMVEVPWRRVFGARYETVFPSAVPRRVRRLADSRPEGTDVWVICEPSWVPMVDRDPILTYEFAGLLWVLGAWDMTPLERVVLREYAVDHR
jgi:hypothetical protein